MNIDGKYEIAEMEQWSKEDLDLTETAYILIERDSGELHFICVDGSIHLRSLGGDNYKFQWEGTDEGDETSGTGEFSHENGTLTGMIYFDNGDESTFKAVKMKI
jgi:hypothetical protein